MDQTQEGNLEACESTTVCKAANYHLQKNILETDMLAQPLVECSKIAAVSTGNVPHKYRKLAKSHLDTGHVSEEDVEETGKINEESNGEQVKDVSKLRVTNQQETGGEFIKDKVAAQHSESTVSDSVIENPINSCKDEKVVKLLQKLEVSSDGLSSGLGKVGFTHPLKVDEKVPSSDIREEAFLSRDLGQYLVTAPITSIKRKLLVLDVNGLLADIVMPAPKDRRGDLHIFGRAIFKRPFCNDFLKFCFENFDVAIWSSRSKKLVDRVVDYLLGNLKDKLVFCWDMAHSTQTGFKTLENIHKPLVCKELNKIWENDDPNLLWKKREYDQYNTLLLDDSPYKALLNPKHTAIFPKSYHYHDKDDNSLGPEGDLRVYLEGLLVSENVQNYVQEHPYGQDTINETSLSWEFYSRVLQAMSSPVQENNPGVVPNLSLQ